MVQRLLAVAFFVVTTSRECDAFDNEVVSVGRFVRGITKTGHAAWTSYTRPNSTFKMVQMPSTNP